MSMLQELSTAEVESIMEMKLPPVDQGRKWLIVGAVSFPSCQCVLFKEKKIDVVPGV